nr:uncharacterized protein LOC107448239 isoform X2 [Parasteatoda tepidariorum]
MCNFSVSCVSQMKIVKLLLTPVMHNCRNKYCGNKTYTTINYIVPELVLFRFWQPIKRHWRKKKSRERKDVFEKIAKVEKSQNSESVEENKPKLVSLTKAERAFLKMKEKKNKWSVFWIKHLKLTNKEWKSSTDI